MSDLQSLCKSSGKIVCRGAKMELLEISNGLDTTVILYHSHGVHSWVAQAFRFGGYEDATSIRGTGLHSRLKEPHGSR